MIRRNAWPTGVTGSTTIGTTSSTRWGTRRAWTARSWWGPRGGLGGRRVSRCWGNPRKSSYQWPTTSRGCWAGNPFFLRRCGSCLLWFRLPLKPCLGPCAGTSSNRTALFQLFRFAASSQLRNKLRWELVEWNFNHDFFRLLCLCTRIIIQIIIRVRQVAFTQIRNVILTRLGAFPYRALRNSDAAGRSRLATIGRGRLRVFSWGIIFAVWAWLFCLNAWWNDGSAWNAIKVKVAW